jgi:hypothetical protein
MSNPTAFLNSITSKTGLQEPAATAINTNFEGSESIAATELANLRKYCLNYVVLKYHMRAKSHDADNNAQISRRNEFLMANVQQAIQKIVDSGDQSSAKGLLQQLKLRSQQQIKLLFSIFLPVPALRFYLLNNLLMLAKDFPLSFVFSMVIEYAFQALFTDSSQVHNILSFIHVIAELNQSMYIIDNVSSSRIPEENLIYFAKKSWKQTDSLSPQVPTVGPTPPAGPSNGTNGSKPSSRGSTNRPPSSKNLTIIDKDMKVRMGDAEVTRFLRLYLPFSQELVFERILKLSFFVRKYLCSVIMNTDTLVHVELIIRRLVTWHPSFVRAMPLKTFISISKTFFCYLNYKITNSHVGLDRTPQPPGNPGRILEQYLEFCLYYFSSNFHYFQKSDTEYSITNAATYHKAVEDLHSLFLAMYRLSEFPLKDSAFANSIGAYSFYNRFVGKLSGISNNLRLTPRPWFMGMARRRQVLSVQYILTGVLFMFKHKIEGLMARMFYNYRYTKTNPAFASFKLTRHNPEAVFDTVFELNPIFAMRLTEAWANQLDDPQPGVDARDRVPDDQPPDLLLPPQLPALRVQHRHPQKSVPARQGPVLLQ